jgi:AcrR family transcriptional regulator
MLLRFNDKVRTMRQQQLLAAAEEMLATDGCQSFSTEALARNVGVAKGTIYSHYSSQRELLDAMFSSITERLLLRVPIESDSLIEDVVSQIANRIVGSPQGAMGYPCCLRSAPCPYNASRKISELLRALIERDAQAGTVPHELNASLAERFFQVLLSAVVNHSSGSDERRRDLLSAVRFWLRGLGLRAGTS